MVVLSEFSEGSLSTHGYRYDVFLSFRGLDTRNCFTAYLHKALMDANITTFLDDEEIETGEDLKPELESAITASRASIIVLSKNYATSTWCLDELVLILEQRMISNHIVIPIFYHVEPTHVRKQQSSFGDAMAEHRQMMEAETNANKRSKWAQKMDRWNKALTEVADLKGKDVKGRRETDFIKEIVKDIYSRLRISSRSPLPQLFGMNYSVKFVTSWLKDISSHTIDVLTILGMGGIGKTSLAKYVYGLYSHEFDKSSFIEDISRRCDRKFNELLDVQKRLCNDLSQTSPSQVYDNSIYTSMIENAVARKKVFVVLDDIDSLDQLDSLLGSKGFHSGSKIIITTKDAWVTENCALFKMNFKPTHAKHLLRSLDTTVSRQLLSFYAFKCNEPMAGYEEVSKKLVTYCQGHPMALKVLGKSLHNRDVAYWEGCIEGLKKENCSPIHNVLKMSYDSLSFKNDKDLFKHITCFFVGMDRDVAETILNACDIDTRSGITNLIGRCLLSIRSNKKLMMHQLLQEMGRSLIREESPDKPWKRSRLWCHDESFKVLRQKKGKRNLLGLAFDMRMLQKEKLHASFELKTNALNNMDNLMLLQLNYVQIKGSCQNFPDELRWLCMHGFPKKYLQLDYPMTNLVVLDMSYSNIESFGISYINPRLESRKKLNGSCMFGSLKILNLSFCQQLYRLGGFDELPSLERLIVRHCIGLLEICESIEQCGELVLVDLGYCTKLENLPSTIGMLKKVKTLSLDGCNLGESPIEFRDKKFYINTITSSSAVLETIPSDSKLFAISLPRCLASLSLANNNLSSKSFPVDFSCLPMLKHLILDKNPITSLPNCIRSLLRLETLSMVNCNMLISVEHPPHTLREVIISSEYNPLLQKVVFNPEMSLLNLAIDLIMLAPSLFEIEGMVKIQPMAGVEEKVLRSLGWTKLDFLNMRHVGTKSYFRRREESEIQLYYEFGIFSTIYGGEEIPNWITDKSMRSSISFTIPSSTTNITGLNFCYVQMRHDCESFRLPRIIINNITKNRMWIYEHYIERVHVGGKCLTFLSHWMFGMNEMECGDNVTITMSKKPYTRVDALTKECGVSFVYNNEEEDVLGYYKSWNHIIGGDLTGFQLTTGEYILHTWNFMRNNSVVDLYYHEFGGHSAKYKEELWFKALSQKKSGILGNMHEGNT